MYKIVANGFKDCQETLQSKRAVAYLDVLGFKKMIQTKDLS